MTYTRSILTAARSVAVEEAEMTAPPEAGWVRLKLATASICGTDMHYYRHFANAGFVLDHPLTMGHEACAYVADANGAALKVGQLVAINPIINCGECKHCRAGDINMCATKRFPGSATTKPHIEGFFRDCFDFPARCLRVVADDTPPDHLTFAEPLACAMHAVNRGGVASGMRVLVTGCGPMGLLATIGAHQKGAEVTVTDLKRSAIDAAVAVGASSGHVAADDLSELSGRFDVVIEASGAPQAYNLALQAARKQGTIAILSLIQPTPQPIDLHLNALKEVSAIGSILFTSEFDDAVDLIEGRGVDFEAITAGRFPVGETAAAFQLMASGDAVGKVLIHPA